MKKRLSMFLVGAMFILSACGSTDAAKVDETVTETTDAADDAAKTTDDVATEVAEAVEEAQADVMDATEEITDEATATSNEVVEPEHTPMDISDCSTFTDIVNKLKADQGYANVTIDGNDLFIVTDYVYDYNGDGQYVTIEGDIYRYNGDKIEYLGYVCSGGTSYPLIVYKDKLYTSGNHYVKAYEIEDSGLEVEDEVYVNFDTDGNATYYKVEDGKDVVIAETDEDAVEMYDFLDKGEMIIFDKIQ